MGSNKMIEVLIIWFFFGEVLILERFMNCVIKVVMGYCKLSNGVLLLLYCK